MPPAPSSLSSSNRRRQLVGPLRERYLFELAAARSSEHTRTWSDAWTHLERAHVLSQPFAGPHVYVHLRMLGLGIRRFDWREVAGQLLRALVAAPGTWLGRAPPGNTGRARVGILTPMPIEEDLKRLLDENAGA